MKVIEYDAGALKEWGSKSHPYESSVNGALQKIGTVVGDKSFYDVAPLTFLVKKEGMRSWDTEKEGIKSKIQEYFPELDKEDLMNFASAIYRIKASKNHLGYMVRDDRFASIPALVAVPDKGTGTHEKEHFVKDLFYNIPSADVGGIAGMFSEPLDTYSLFNVEFLPHLIEDGNAERYLKNVDMYPYAHPKIDEAYESRIKEFADVALKFVNTHKDGLLALTALYPVYRQTTSNSSPLVWANFDAPDNPSDDIESFEGKLIDWGYDQKAGIVEDSEIGRFLKEKFDYYNKEWLQLYENQIG